MKKSLHAFSLAALLAAPHASHAAAPEGYYDSLEGKCGVELKQAVKALVADHVVVSYGDPNPDNYFHPVYVSTWTVFKESDTRPVDDVLCWWDMYSAINIWVSDGHPGLNIEHSVANSWWGGEKGSKEAYNDLHHLNPSNGDANGQKSNWPLGTIQGLPYWTNGVTTTGTPAAGLGDGATRVFDPYWSYKGDFARAYFYIFTVYDDIPWTDSYAWMYNTASDLTLKPWAYDMLLEWSKGDAVTDKEIKRNDVVYQYQENRNPFIDCPTLADHIWGDLKDQPFHYELYTPEVADPEIYPGWDETFTPMAEGRWAPVSSTDDLNIDEEYFIVTPARKRAMTYTLISTGKAMDECPHSPVFTEGDSPAAITAVPQQIATVRLEDAGDGYWYVGVYDPDYNFKGYLNVAATNSATLSQNRAATCRTKITVDASENKTIMEFDVKGEAYTLQYNSGNPRFAAYKSNQNPIQLYRATDEVESGVGAVNPDAATEEVIEIYDINGRRIEGNSTVGLQKGIYIVVTPSGTKKILK